MLKGHRSHIVNILTAVIAILALPEVGGILPPEYVKFVPVVQAVVAVIMRQVTTTPAGKAE
jgi:hypothetical protein